MRTYLVSRLCRATVGAGLAVVGLCWAIGDAAPPAGASAARKVTIAIGAENEYANVISQIGGQYVRTTSILNNPNTDPHTFESSPKVAQVVEKASLIVQNGVGYDTFMTKIEQASPRSSRKVINVQHLLGLPDTTPNPHLWYRPTTMPAVAKAVAADLTSFQPSHAAYFQQNVEIFDASLAPYNAEIAKIKATFPTAPVATTEPVGDYMLQAAGIDNMTPFTLQAAIMNTTDPSPQDVTIQNKLFTSKKVKVFVYNQQVTNSLTQSFLKLAKANGIPIVGVYETMPVPGYNYQNWMLAEADAVYSALANGKSSPKL